MFRNLIEHRTRQQDARIAQYALTGILGVVLVIMVIHSLSISGTMVADPTRGYSPTEFIPTEADLNMREWLTSTPLTWVAALLTITIWAATIVSRRVAAGVAALLLFAAALFIGMGGSADSAEDSFSLWAKQRYGIEIEEYPKPSTGIFGNNEPVDTTETILLDNGQAIGFRSYTDARGNKAFIIVDRSDGSGDLDNELEIVTGS